MSIQGLKADTKNALLNSNGSALRYGGLRCRGQTNHGTHCANIAKRGEFFCDRHIGQPAAYKPMRFVMNTNGYQAVHCTKNCVVVDEASYSGNTEDHAPEVCNGAHPHDSSLHSSGDSEKPSDLIIGVAAGLLAALRINLPKDNPLMETKQSFVGFVSGALHASNRSDLAEYFQKVIDRDTGTA